MKKQAEDWLAAIAQHLSEAQEARKGVPNSQALQNLEAFLSDAKAIGNAFVDLTSQPVKQVQEGKILKRSLEILQPRANFTSQFKNGGIFERQKAECELGEMSLSFLQQLGTLFFVTLFHALELSLAVPSSQSTSPPFSQRLRFYWGLFFQHGECHLKEALYLLGVAGEFKSAPHIISPSTFDGCHPIFTLPFSTGGSLLLVPSEIPEGSEEVQNLDAAMKSSISALNERVRVQKKLLQIFEEEMRLKERADVKFAEVHNAKGKLDSLRLKRDGKTRELAKLQEEAKQTLAVKSNLSSLLVQVQNKERSRQMTDGATSEKIADDAIQTCQERLMLLSIFVDPSTDDLPSMVKENQNTFNQQTSSIMALKKEIPPLEAEISKLGGEASSLEREFEDLERQFKAKEREATRLFQDASLQLGHHDPHHSSSPALAFLQEQVQEHSKLLRKAQEGIQLANGIPGDPLTMLQAKKTQPDAEGFLFDAFLSHYQATGGEFALILKLLLLQRKPELRVFLDVDYLENVDNLETHVKSTRTFLLLITPGVLDRPAVQREIICAIQEKKNIILVHDKRAEGFPSPNPNWPPEVTQIIKNIAVPFERFHYFRLASIQAILDKLI